MKTAKRSARQKAHAATCCSDVGHFPEVATGTFLIALSAVIMLGWASGLASTPSQSAVMPASHASTSTVATP